MPRDKTQSHIRIIDSAKKEFMEYGFVDASLRRIASNANIQVSGLYNHFSNKEEMFASLVDPVVQGFMECYHMIEDNYYSELDNLDPSTMWQESNGPTKMMEYIYEHFDEFKLIICKSQGTRYENFTHDIAILEEKVTISYMNELKKRGFKIVDLDKKEFHLLVTSNIEAIFQVIAHDFSKEEAMHYAKTLEKFYPPAWKAVFGL